MAKRKYRCTRCKFQGTGPSSLNAHYQLKPNHAPITSVMHPRHSKGPAPERKLNMAPARVHARQRRADKNAGTFVDKRLRPNKVTKRKAKPTKRLSSHPLAKRSRKYRKAVSSGKHRPKPHRTTQLEPQPEMMPMSSMSAPPPPPPLPDCIPHCPRCRLYLSTLNRAYQVTIQEEHRNA